MSQEGLFQALFDASPDGILTVADDGRIVLANQRAEDLFGYERGALRGARVESLMPARFRAGHTHLRESYTKSPRPRPMGTGLKLVGTRQDGTEFPLEITLSPMVRGAEALTIAIVRDVTERREAERAIEMAHKEIEDLYDHAPCGYHSLDGEGRFLRINETELRWLDRAREEVIGASFVEHISEASRHFFAEAFARFKQAGSIEGLEMELVRRDGTVFPVLISATAIRDATGTFVSSRSTVVDDTDRRRIMGALRRANEELETANKELETFSYSVAHDLRAPLRAVDGFTLIALEDLGEDVPADVKGNLERVRDAARRMGELIDDLLMLSRTTTTELRQQPNVDLSALASSVVKRLREADTARKVEVTIEPGLSTCGDPKLLLILLENLIGNAWKFTSKKPLAHIEVGAEQGDEIRYFVRDDGAGFDMSLASKLFQPFQRLHARGQFEGTGIGLATAARVVRRHGGRLWADAAEGRGATFYFTLASTCR
ncbi:MAG: PAS domain S-box protein [Myxococcales bacterium]|nr:PAS domain S-box protein [Myxococcales bacterium]